MHFIRTAIRFIYFINDNNRMQVLNAMLFATQNGFVALALQKHLPISKTPSAIFKTRSTSPPKSVWPGVSITFILTPL